MRHVGASSRNMFVIELIYKVDLTQIDAHMRAHVRFLKKYYAAGTFLVSGRKIPRDGGIILAVGRNKEEIQSLSTRTRSTHAASPTSASPSFAPASGPTTSHRAWSSDRASRYPSHRAP